MCKQKSDVRLNCYDYIKYLKSFNCVQKNSSGSFKNVIYKMCLQIIYI